MFDKYGKVFENFNLINHNTYKVECICDYFIVVDDIIKLTNLLKYLKDNNYKYFIIGNGSNIILPNYYNGVVIKLNLNEIIFNKNKVIVSASVMMPHLVNKCLDNDLTSLEWAYGIPGTIGGCVYNNAGAYNDEIANYIDEVEVLENNKIKILKRSDIEFEYRNTSLKNRDLVILKVTLKLIKGDKVESWNLIKDRQERRINTQPLDKHSAGSVFRNPDGDYAGRLIEEFGLKGKSIGGAKISEKHANFIINEGNATGEDVVKLINYIKNVIKKETDIDLVLEQEIIN